MKQGHVLWVTGLSGSGKTTLSLVMADYWREKGIPVVVLDGDILRDIFKATDGYHREARLDLALRYGRLVKSISDQGVNVIIATISMFKEVYAWNRENLKVYTEVYIDVPMDELQRRDSKGIYSGAQAGVIKHVAGVDFAIEAPSSPHVHLVWEPTMTIEAMKHDVSTYLEERC